MTKNILLLGSGAREHAIARAVARSPQTVSLYCFSSTVNPGIKVLTEAYHTGDICSAQQVLSFVADRDIAFAIIGPEAPLEKGIADALLQVGIPVVGPKRQLAQIETSKAFARHLWDKYHINGAPDFRVFHSMEGVAAYLQKWSENYVIKVDSLMGGKGVKVFGDHLQSDEEALAHCQSLINQGLSFVIEEKLDGQEFSLISFSDGKHVVHMPVVQDHKRAFVGDTGPNTGGMGSYSDANHLLPFLTQRDVYAAQQLNEKTIHALREETGEKYIGFLYGGFMATSQGIKLVEYNARLGDPEALNLLALLEPDFVDICEAMVSGVLHQTDIHFARRATVCKYAVPKGYPDQPVKGEVVDVSGVENPSQLYLSAVDEKNGVLIETGSRAVAVVGIADTISEAEQLAEKEINRIKGPLFHREDIGTQALIERRIAHMVALRAMSELSQ